MTAFGLPTPALGGRALLGICTLIGLSAFKTTEDRASDNVQRGKSSIDDPVEATAFLKGQGGRVFTTYWWDDYLI